MLQKRLSVVANPFAVPLDHLGRPCAAVLYDPALSAGNRRYIGANMTQTTLQKREFKYSPSQKQQTSGGGQLDKMDISWSFDLAPVEIEDSRYHRKAIADGLLLPANEFTAKAGGVKLAPIAQALAKAQLSAVTEWERGTENTVDVASWKLVNMPKQETRPTQLVEAPNDEVVKAGDK